MPMERSVSCAERGTKYGGMAGPDLRSYNASYARPAPQPSSRVKHARSVSSWTCPVPPHVQRSGSTKSATEGRPTPGLNLRPTRPPTGPPSRPTVALGS
ncbi:hypothetical protein BAE44_0014452 [Dichanthelium oligosanthes]|uniref:Uncharacterized protein n=1 Tax=Dichanthelium oligosanthes TaxID=888268 RepID=A0A1E5VHC6_9POAL|nr:hypothetical protein BAE44_0014452 [Dichanthelium oligosanthes]